MTSLLFNFDFMPVFSSLGSKAEATSQTFQTEVITVALVLITLILIISGFLWMIGMSAQAKKLLTGLVIGILLIVFSGPLGDFLKSITGR